LSAQDTAKRFFRSAGAAAFSQFWRVGVTLMVRPLLRRWIPDADWGLFDWTLTVFLILGAVRDLGLVYHVVRVKPRPYGNLLALELVWGAVLAVTSFVAAPALVAHLNDPHPAALGVIRAFGIFLFFEGLGMVPKTFFEAELNVGRTVMPEILRNLAFASLATSMAWAGYGVWSLVAGHVAAAIVYALLLWWRAWGKLELTWLKGQTLALLRRSTPLAVIWFLLILVQNVDPLILRERFSDRVVAWYRFGYENAFLVSLILVPAITRALYPALVAFRHDARQLFESYRLATLCVMALEVPAALFLFANAEAVLRILGGPEWVEPCTPFLRVLCFAPLIDPLSRLGGEVLKTLHKDGIWIASSGITLASFAVGGWILTGTRGPMGMAWANYLPLGGLVMAWAIHRVAPRGFRRLLKDLVLIYLVPTLVFLLVYFTVADLVIRFAVSLLALGAVIFVFWKRYGPQFVAFFRDPVAATETTSD